MQTHLIEAIDAALANDWYRAHNIVQQYDDPLACWIHAVLHKIEGDVGNSRYWYVRTDRRYEHYARVLETRAGEAKQKKPPGWVAFC